MNTVAVTAEKAKSILPKLVVTFVLIAYAMAIMAGVYRQSHKPIVVEVANQSEKDRVKLFLENIRDD